MFTKGNKVYADAGKYLVSKDGKRFALNVVGNQEDYIEEELNSPLDIIIEGRTVNRSNS